MARARHYKPKIKKNQHKATQVNEWQSKSKRKSNANKQIKARKNVTLQA